MKNIRSFNFVLYGELDLKYLHIKCIRVKLQANIFICLPVICFCHLVLITEIKIYNASNWHCDTITKLSMIYDLLL